MLIQTLKPKSGYSLFVAGILLITEVYPSIYKDALNFKKVITNNYSKAFQFKESLWPKVFIMSWVHLNGDAFMAVVIWHMGWVGYSFSEFAKWYVLLIVCTCLLTALRLPSLCIKQSRSNVCDFVCVFSSINSFIYVKWTVLITFWKRR